MNQRRSLFHERAFLPGLTLDGLELTEVPYFGLSEVETFQPGMVVTGLQLPARFRVLEELVIQQLVHSTPGHAYVSTAINDAPINDVLRQTSRSGRVSFRAGWAVLFAMDAERVAAHPSARKGATLAGRTGITMLLAGDMMPATSGGRSTHVVGEVSYASPILRRTSREVIRIFGGKIVTPNVEPLDIPEVLPEIPVPATADQAAGETTAPPNRAEELARLALRLAYNTPGVPPLDVRRE